MLNRLSIAQRFWFISLLAGSLFAISVAIGWVGLKAARDSLKAVYEDRAVPLQDLGQIQGFIDANYAHVLAGFQHDPNGALHAAHDHPISLHTDAVRESKSKIDALWAKFMATNLTEEEKVLAADFVARRKAWVDKLLVEVEALDRGDYSVSNLSGFLAAGREERKSTSDALTALMDLQQRVAKEEFEAAEARYQLDLVIFMVLVAIGVVGVMGTTWLTTRRISSRRAAFPCRRATTRRTNATHKHPEVKAWLAKHPRFHMHFTPTSSSWLNLVERFFRDLTDHISKGKCIGI